MKTPPPIGFCTGTREAGGSLEQYIEIAETFRFGGGGRRIVGGASDSPAMESEGDPAPDAMDCYGDPCSGEDDNPLLQEGEVIERAVDLNDEGFLPSEDFDAGEGGGAESVAEECTESEKEAEQGYDSEVNLDFWAGVEVDPGFADLGADAVTSSPGSFDDAAQGEEKRGDGQSQPDPQAPNEASGCDSNVLPTDENDPRWMDNIHRRVGERLGALNSRRRWPKKQEATSARQD